MIYETDLFSFSFVPNWYLQLDALAELAHMGYDPKYGARPLRRAIQEQVEDAVAEQILEGLLHSGDTARLTLEQGRLSVTK